MRKTLTSIFFLILSYNAISQVQVSYSIQGHDDDWQLFMSSKIMSDLSGGGKVVFITTTAGDGGNGAGSGPSTIPYYLARERGSVYSSKYASDIAGGIISDTPTAVIVSINGHSIIKYSYNNNKVVNYFLRLPDGKFNGTGFTATAFKSLQKLYQGAIPNISSVDGLTTFSSWNDLTGTIKAIMMTEKGNDNQVWVHTASLDTTNSNPVLRNSEGHSDHYYSSKAVQVAIQDSLWVGINEFIDYRSASLPANLSASDQENATALFGICTWGLMESKYLGTFEINHKNWLPMDYFSVKRSPVGNAGF
jgi:hypothetical protein